MIFVNLGGSEASRHLSYRWGKIPKKPHPGDLSRPGIEPGPAAWQARMLPPGPQRWTLSERDNSLIYLQTHPLLHFLVWMKPTSMNVFLQVAKNVEVTREKIWLYGEWWSVSQPNLWNLSLTRFAVWWRSLSCKRMIPSDNISERFDFMAHYSTLTHQGTDLTSLHFFACLNFQCCTNTLSLRSPPEQ